VRLGEYDISKEIDCVDRVCNKPVIEIDIEESIVHPQYDANSNDRHHDIALLRLSQPVELNAFLQPVCLPLAQVRSVINPKEELVVSGWGRTLTCRLYRINRGIS